MYILGIDTATKVAGTAVVKDGRLISERFIHNKLTHSQVLLPMVDSVLSDAGIKITELQGIAVTRGPGSFTGLRIGMAFAKTVAQVLNIPVAPISTLRVLAENALHFQGLVCPIMDARKNEVYTCIYKASAGSLEQLTPEAALGIEQLIKEILRFGGDVLFLGDGVPVFFDLLQDRLGQRADKASETNLFSRAGAAAIQGYEIIERGEAPRPEEILPVYLRRSEAEITWEKKRGELVDEKAGGHETCPS